MLEIKISIDGDVVTVNVSAAAGQGTLAITTDQAGTNVVATAGGVGIVGNNALTITEAVGNTIWLSRDATNNTWNGVVDAIFVTRSCETSTDCEIKSLTINGETITPSAKVYSYEVPALSALTEVAVAYSIHLLATANPASGFTVAVPTAGDPANTQTITVTAEDGTTSDTYTVSISKATAASDVVTLDALAVTGYTLDPTFDAATLAYNITKAYGAEDPTSDKVTYTKSEEAQNVDVVYDGTNHKFVVTVTAEDNITTQDYEITINEAEAPKSLSRVLFSNGFDAFIDNTNHTVKAYYLAGATAPTATTITAGAGAAGALSEGKIRVTGADDSYVDYVVTLEEVTPNTTAVAEADPAGEFAGDEAWVKNGLLVYGNAAGYSAGDKWYVNRRLLKSGEAADDQRVIAGWVRSYFFVGNAYKFIMTVSNNTAIKYSIDGGEQVANNATTVEITLPAGNHMIEIVSNQSNGDCRLSAPKLVERPKTYSVTYQAGEGTGDDVIDGFEYAAGDEVTVQANAFTAPDNKKFNGWASAPAVTISEGKFEMPASNVVLTAQWINHYAVTFNMNGHGDAIDPQDIKEGAKATRPDDPIAIGFDFGGWFTDEECTAGNEFDFNTSITAVTPLFAKWTAFAGCTMLYPATSGPAIAVGDEIAMQTGSSGATMVAISSNSDCTLAYESYGLSFASSGNTSRVKVTLDHELAVGSKITLVLVANGSSGSNRALDLYKNTTKVTSIGWTSSDTYAKYDEGTFTYTVTNEDGLAGMNEFSLYRNNSVFLQKLTVEACGAAITYHNLTSVVDPEGKGTVTLGAASVREGYTTTATYSVSDPLYEFVNWTVSGAGASVADATANPATITVGTEDAVVTLNLRLIPIKFTVEYYNGATLMGSEQVVVNEHPTASEIVTAKRGYVFEGWATSSTATASDVINLNTITSDVATAIPLYAIYTAVPCVSEGTVFSMTVTDLAGTQYEENNDFGLEIGATYLGGKAYSGSKSTTKRIGEIDENGEYSFNKNGDVTVKVAMDCALQEGDVITFTTSTTRELKIQKVAGTTLVTTSGKKYVIPAESPLIGEYDFYLMRDNSASTFKTLKVERPYTISFDMQGHGDAIEAQKLIAGDKVVEPTAPTADGWDFKGWYKESACTNAWDFENDVVAGTMALYAKWDVHVTNDATLKSLKYGETEIALEAGVFEYNIGLPALTASVPALTAVANSATVHSLDIVDAAAFDVDGKATSTVTVVSEDETVTNVYTVNFSKLAALPLADVTESTTWNFANAVTANVSITGTPQVLANYAGVTNDNTFESDKLEASGEKFTAGSKANLRANYIHFHTTVPGMLTISYSNTGGSNPARYIYVNGAKYDEDGSANTTPKGADNKVFVPAGDVKLVMMDGEDASKNVQIYQMIFNANPDYIRDVRQGYYGTICLPNGGIMTGAAVYEIAYMDYKDDAPYKIYFDEILNGKMEAGVPYIFLPNEGADKLAVFYTDEANESAKSANGLYGFIGASATDEYQIPSGVGNYIIQNNQYREVLAGADARIVSNRAYIKLSEIPGYNDPLYVAPAPAPGRKRIAMGTTGAQVATGVDQVQGDEVPTKMIINGQLFILRGEKMYDAQGKLVK